MIELSNVEGITWLHGEDAHGNHWTQFQVDYLAEQEDGECRECGATLDHGWLCLDGGEEVCSKHIAIV